MNPICRRVFALLLLLTIGAVDAPLADGLPVEKPLWPEGELGELIQYDQEVVRSPKAQAESLSGSNRVFSDVEKPTYSIHQADPEKANGVGLVICPGGGYVDVWLDREGHDLGIWLKERGVTSLVLKYRTNAGALAGGRKYSWDDYLPVVTTDARQAIRTMRSQASDLGVNPEKIGICGFSAGGNLAIRVALFPEKTASGVISGNANFAGLFYPWLREDYSNAFDSTEGIPPLFVMNAVDDQLTPAAKCMEFYGWIMDAKIPSELHIFGKGNHGFDLGQGRGESAAIWPSSFLAWLGDSGFIQ
jgi:acetyl esterase/lipase